MDKASVYGTGDSGFDSQAGLFSFQGDVKYNYHRHALFPFCSVAPPEVWTHASNDAEGLSDR